MNKKGGVALLAAWGWAKNRTGPEALCKCTREHTDGLDLVVALRSHADLHTEALAGTGVNLMALHVTTRKARRLKREQASLKDLGKTQLGLPFCATGGDVRPEIFPRPLSWVFNKRRSWVQIHGTRGEGNDFSGFVVGLQGETIGLGVVPDEDDL